jgi:replicative DNA helicase
MSTEYNLEQELPNNVDAERAILGAILLDSSGQAFEQTVGHLESDYFYLDSHRRIFLRCSELVACGKPIDYVTLTEQLGMHGEIEAVGGVIYVTSLTDSLPRVKNISQYVRIVRDKALLRGLIRQSNGNIAAAYEQEETAQTIIARALDGILGLQTGCTEEPSHVSDFGDQVIADLERCWDKPETIQRYSLGIDEITKRTGGLMAEEYAVIQGRTGDGKSGWSSQIALENALVGRPVLFNTLELSKEILFLRMICQIAKVSNRVVIKKIEQPLRTERERIKLAKKVITEAPIFIDDTTPSNIGQLVAKARQWKRRHCQEKDGLVITDYIQKVPSRFKENRDKVTEVSEGFRRLAKEEKTRVIAVSQTGRPDRKNANQRLTKFDAKESGSIENDAHFVLSVYRPVDDHGFPTGADEILACKSRDGETWSEAVEYQGHVYTFVPRQSAP